MNGYRNYPGNVGYPSGFTSFFDSTFVSWIVITCLVIVLVFAVYQLIKVIRKNKI
jgi:hypothetical protein